MNIKLKKENKDGMLRVETSGKIKEVLIKEDLLAPQKEMVSLCFRGQDSSGMIELTTKELESVYRQIKDHLHLVKRSRVL